MQVDPPTVNVVQVPLQIGDGVGTDIEREGLTVTTTVVVPVHPFLSVPFTV